MNAASTTDRLYGRIAAAARNRSTRRLVYVVLAIVLAILCVFPQPYVARTKILPQNDSSAGLSSILGALGGRLQNFASLLGDQQSIAVYLLIGRSENVMDAVIADLKLVGPQQRYDTVRDARIDIAKKVEINALAGGVIEIEAVGYNPDYALLLTQSYARTMSQRISVLGQDNINLKRKIVTDRFAETSDRVARAEAALNAFRRTNRLTEPEAEVRAALEVRTGLEARLQAREVELNTMRQFAGPENNALRALEADVRALRSQVAGAQQLQGGRGAPNLAGLTAVSGQYINLFREYKFSQMLFEVYSRYSEEVAVEELLASRSSKVQVIETPHLDAQRKYNVSAVAGLLLLTLLAFFTEIYAPMTGLRITAFGDEPDTKAG